jgi:hypothetical protein
VRGVYSDETAGHIERLVGAGWRRVKIARAGVVLARPDHEGELVLKNRARLLVGESRGVCRFPNNAGYGVDRLEVEAHTPAVAGRRDEENAIYSCMAMPTDLHRVHSPEDDPAVHVARKRWRTTWQRILRTVLRRVEPVS